MIIINNFIEYKALEGQMVGFSDWHTIDQQQINRFAEATLDDQWIHVGIENFKFRQPVLVDNRVQLQAFAKSITNLRGTVKVVIEATLNIEEQTKPAYIGDVIFLYYFS